MEHNPLKEDGILGFDIIKNNCIIDASSDKIVWIDNNKDVPIRYRSRKDSITITNDNDDKDELVSVENDLINSDDDLVKNVVDASSSLMIMWSQKHGIGESKGDIENHSSLNMNQKRNVIEGSVDTYGSLTNTVNKEYYIKESEVANSSILDVIVKQKNLIKIINIGIIIGKVDTYSMKMNLDGKLKMKK